MVSQVKIASGPWEKIVMIAPMVIVVIVGVALLSRYFTIMLWLLFFVNTLVVVFSLGWLLGPDNMIKMAPPKLKPLTIQLAYLGTSVVRVVAPYLALQQGGESAQARGQRELGGAAVELGASQSSCVPDFRPLRVEKKFEGTITPADLAALSRSGDPNRFMQAVRFFVQQDPRVLTLPTVKEWAGKRWRNLFVANAASDPAAVTAASNPSQFFGLLTPKDERCAEEKVSLRFLKGSERLEWSDKLPACKQEAAPKTMTLLLCPGLLNGLLPVRAFMPALAMAEEKFNMRVLRADAHPLRGCEKNVADLRAALDGKGLDAQGKRTAGEPLDDVICVCYSKGAPDLLTLLATDADARKRIKGVFIWAGAVGGSYIADPVYESVKAVDMKGITERMHTVLQKICPIVDLRKGGLSRSDEIDLTDAIKHLSTSFRETFLQEHRALFDSWDIPIFNIPASTTVMEVPYFQAQGTLALNMFDNNNDMQLTNNQARLACPMAVDLAMLHGNHWDVSYGPFPAALKLGSQLLEHPFPKPAALFAMVQLSLELGLIQD